MPHKNTKEFKSQYENDMQHKTGCWPAALCALLFWAWIIYAAIRIFF